MEYYSSDPHADRINRLRGEMNQVRPNFSLSFIFGLWKNLKTWSWDNILIGNMLMVFLFHFPEAIKFVLVLFLGHWLWCFLHLVSYICVLLTTLYFICHCVRYGMLWYRTLIKYLTEVIAWSCWSTKLPICKETHLVSESKPSILGGPCGGEMPTLCIYSYSFYPFPFIVLTVIPLILWGHIPILPQIQIHPHPQVIICGIHFCHPGFGKTAWRGIFLVGC